MGFADGDWDKASAAGSVTAMMRRLRVLRRATVMGLRDAGMAAVPDRLSLRLTGVILAVGLLLFLCANAVQIASSAQRQKAAATEVVLRMEQIAQHQLAQALWEFDFDGVENLLNGLMLHRDIGHLELVSPTGHIWARGTPVAGAEAAVFDLTVTNAHTGETDVGTLALQISLEAVSQRVWAEIRTAVITTGLLSLPAAGILLFLLQRMLVRHATQVVRHLNRVQPVDPLSRLTLPRRPTVKPDVLDRIVTAVQGYETRVEGYVDKLNDVISQREQSQSRVEQAMQRHSQFLSTVSQDIRAPLQSISGLFELIQNSDDVPEHHRQQAAVGQRASRRMGVQLINMLDLALLDSEDLTPQITATPLQPMVEGWADLATDLAAERQHDIAVEVTLDQGLSAAYDLDAACVSRVMECLIDNATKFCQRGMLGIELRACLMDHDETSDVVLPVTCSTCSGLAILVRDCGPVIDYDHRERVFERFTRVDEHLTRKTEGAGLGLALARRFAEVMGGSLKIRDCTDARFNNEFLLCLPAVTAAKVD